MERDKFQIKLEVQETAKRRRNFEKILSIAVDEELLELKRLYETVTGNNPNHFIRNVVKQAFKQAIDKHEGAA